MISVAWAADAPSAAPGGMAMFGQFIPLILIFLVFYFLLIRPQAQKAKAQQNYLAGLKKGDKVITTGGIYGQITGLTDTAVTLEVADNVRIKVSRSCILGPAAEAEKTAGQPAAKEKDGKENKSAS